MKNEFTRLFKYMTERFDKIDEALEEKANNIDIQRVLGLLDELAKRQLERLDRWTQELAKKIGYELSA
jgi:hypothetical protein